MVNESIKNTLHFLDKSIKQSIQIGRTLSGTEYDEIWMLLQLLEPVSSSNNQITCSDTFVMNDYKYVVTYFGPELPMIDEYTIENKT